MADYYDRDEGPRLEGADNDTDTTTFHTTEDKAPPSHTPASATEYHDAAVAALNEAVAAIKKGTFGDIAICGMHLQTAGIALEKVTGTTEQLTAALQEAYRAITMSAEAHQDLTRAITNAGTGKSFARDVQRAGAALATYAAD
jgi:hypothetical protein